MRDEYEANKEYLNTVIDLFKKHELDLEIEEIAIAEGVGHTGITIRYTTEVHKELAKLETPIFENLEICGGEC